MLQAGVVEVEGDARMTGRAFTAVEFYGSGFAVPSWSYRENADATGLNGMPIVITQVNSYFGSNWVKTRQQQGDNLHFLVALEEVGGFVNNGVVGHTNFEKVAWLATEMGIGNFGVRNYMAGLTPQAVTHEDYEIGFWTSFVDTPRFFAAMQTYAGTDSSQLRMRDINDDGATVFVEEETCTDDEMNHAREIVGYIALDSASTGASDEYDQIIHAQSNLDRGCEALYDATSADLHGAVLDHNSGGSLAHQSRGGIDFINLAGDTATWQITNCRSGHYYVIFGYALAGGADRPMSVTVNEVVVDGYTSFPLTGSWASYGEVKVPVRLDAGTNTIVLSAIGFSGPNVDYMAISPIGPIGYGETTTIGEGGHARTVDYRMTASGLMGQTVSPEEQWLTVHLGGQYTDPVVIVGPPTEVGGQESVARIKSLRYSTAQQAGQQGGTVGGTVGGNNLSDQACDGHCFDLRLQEPSCQDDLHVEEEVPWLVLDAGTWFTDDGKMIQVGRLPISGADTSTTCCIPGGNPAGTASCCIGTGEGILTGGWSDVTFHVPFPDDEVAIFTQVQTYNDPLYVKTRNRPMANAGGPAFGSGFQVALERDQVQGQAIGTHGVESVGWIAIQHGQSTVGGDLYQADMTDDRITHDPASGGIAFCSDFTAAPLFFANMMTYDGADPSQLRLQQPVSATQANVYIEEVTCNAEDNTGEHTTEVVSYLAIQHDGNHKIRATAQAPTQGLVHTGRQILPGQGVDCGGAADVGDNPGWGWEDTAGTTGVNWAGAAAANGGTTHGVAGNGASQDTCFDAIRECIWIHAAASVSGSVLLP